MLLKRVLLTVLLTALAGTAHAQGAGKYLLTGNSGGELQIGTGLPLPIGSAGIFLGRTSPPAAARRAASRRPAAPPWAARS